MIRRYRSDILALLLVCGAVLAGFFEVPFMGRTFSAAYTTASANGLTDHVGPPGQVVDVPTDDVRVDRGASAWQFEPWGEVVARSIRSGQWPLWNPYSATGKPLAANMQSAAFDPLLLPVHLHATPLLWDLCFLFAMLLGAVGGYAFLRNLRLGPVAAVAGSLTFSLSGFFFVHSNNQFFRSYIYLPLLFLAVDRVTSSRRPLAVLGLAAALAGNFLVGMPESTLFVVGAAIAYALFRLVTTEDRVPAFAALAGSGALALALVLPLAVLFVEYVPLAYHAHEDERKVGLLVEPARWLLSWVVPFARGRGPFLGVREWVGAGALTAVVAAFAGHRLLRRSGAWFVAVIGALVLAKIYGAPGITELGRLPLLVTANFPGFAPPVAAFAVAVLAAVGVQAVADGEVDRRLLAGGAVLGLAVVAVLADRNRHELLRGANGVIPFAAALAAFVIAAVAVVAWRGRGPAVVLTGVIVVELLVLAPRGIYPERAEPYTPTPAVHLLRADGLSPTERTYSPDALLFPDIAGAFGIADVRTIDGLYPGRFFSYLHTFVQPAARTRYVGGAYGGEPGEEDRRSEVAGNPMWDLLGVRYLLSAGTLPEEPVLLNRIFLSRAPDLGVRPDAFDIAGDRRAVLFVHSEQRVTIPVDPAAAALSFSVALHPDAYADPEADGVEFVVTGRPVAGGRRELFRSVLVPGRDPVQPAWRPARVALDGPGGPFAEVTLSVLPRGNGRMDWAGWADLAFDPPAGSAARPPQYRSIGTTGSTTVYRNREVAPRAFVVHDVVGVADEDAAVRRFRSTEGRFPGGAVHVRALDPLETAVVEGVASRRRTCRGEPVARITRYEPQRVEVEVEAACPGLLVLTDTYYPGWKAEVDGEAAEVHPTDILFRGVDVPSGRSTVVFRYQPANFRLGLLGPPLGMGAWAVWAAWRRWDRGRRRGDPEPEPADLVAA